jgi:hypothetical protein
VGEQSTRSTSWRGISSIMPTPSHISASRPPTTAFDRARVLAVLVLVPYEMRLELRDGEDGEVEERSWS